MSKLKFSNSKFSKFISSKGFYVAIAVCLVGAGAATWLAVDRTITGIENANSRILQDDVFQDFPQLEEADTRQADVSNPEVSKPAASQSSKASSSSSTASSSSEPLPESSAQPETSEPSPTSPALQSLSFAMPVRGSILTKFSVDELIKDVTQKDWRTHNGIDIAAPVGETVMAAANGTISEITADSMWGTVVTIDHPDGSQTVYSGLAADTMVKVGDAVLVRDPIGRVDSIPAEVEMESHLHFSLRKDGAWIDPLSVMTKAEDN